MTRRRRRILGFFGLFVLGLGGFVWVVYGGGAHQGPGVVTDVRTPEASVQTRVAQEDEAATALDVDAPEARQILFGDLHVHTTFSADAFLRSLPMVGGTGAHPPADACDFARYCSALDFFAITDHAEALTTRHWDETIESLRECNAVTGEGEYPDLIPFAGWEWSQVGLTAQEHYGHKNIILRGLQDEDLPARPIGAMGPLGRSISNTGLSFFTQMTIPIRDFPNRDRYMDFFVYQRELEATQDCPTGVDTRELPADCREVAETPAELFEKLEQWGMDAMVIPHGTTWGFYTPPGYLWDKQLAPMQRHSGLQRIIEVFSGHGNSEEYRDVWAADRGPGGELLCPEPTDDYEPCCWRAGELIRARCEGVSDDVCEARVETARGNYLAAGAAGHLTVTGAQVEDWGNCGQCTDCFDPAFQYRSGGAAQYILARAFFGDDGVPQHERFGFIASSDNHSARPGTGYKEIGRMEMTEAAGPSSETWRELVIGERPAPGPESRALELGSGEIAPFRLVDVERQSSFFMTGGLVAVHSEGRSRDAIWDAFDRREVYGTSGPRILLWFDLIDEVGARHAMGSELTTGHTPRFEVRAAGDFRQQDGCPAWTTEQVPADRLTTLCLDQCYYPSDTRNQITRVEIVRIRPQLSEDEVLGELIEDPWQVFDCPADPTGCVATFEDPEYTASGRDTVYYARAVQAPSGAVNAGGLRCEGEDCDPCYGDYRTDRSDDCLSDTEERAWSSPIFLTYIAPPPPVVPQGTGQGTGSTADGLGRRERGGPPDRSGRHRRHAARRRGRRPRGWRIV